MKLTYKTDEYEIEVEVTEKELSHLVGALKLFEKIKQFSKAKEHKPNPNWETAPTWANYWAVDKSGYSYWFEDKPFIYNDILWENSSKGNYSEGPSYDLSNIDWKTTLRKRLDNG